MTTIMQEKGPTISASSKSSTCAAAAAVAAASPTSAATPTAANGAPVDTFSEDNIPPSTRLAFIESIRWKLPHIEWFFPHCHVVQDKKDNTRKVVAKEAIPKHTMIYEGNCLLQVDAPNSALVISAVALHLSASPTESKQQPAVVNELWPRTETQLTNLLKEETCTDLVSGESVTALKPSPHLFMQAKIFSNMWVEKNHIWLFGGASFFNHGCKPNVHYHLHDHTGKIFFMTLVDVAAGEELRWAYYGVVPDKLYERAAFLKSKIIRHCTCPACLGKETDIRAYTNVYARSMMEAGKICSYCGNGAISPLLCGQCRLQKYCQKACQFADWKQHKLVCQKRTAAATTAPTVPASCQ
jgi:hypothetical protein